MSLKAVVLAAGEGTRMRPLTHRRPKPLVPVAGRPIIEHIAGGLASAGVSDICLVIGYLGEQLQRRLGDGMRLGTSLHYRWQEEYGGTGAALLLAEDFIGDDSFVLGWGDIIIPPSNYRRMLQVYERERPEAMLAVNRVEDPWEGAAVYVRDGLIDRIIEKPEPGTSSTNFNNAGLFVFGPEMLEVLRETPLSPRGELEVPSAIDAMLQAGARIRAFEIQGYWSDVARPSSAVAISGEIIRGMSHCGWIRHPQARLAPGAELIPPVLIGPDAVVEAARIGPNVTVMAGARVGRDSAVADAIVLPGAVVGAGCDLQSVVVEEGAQVPDGTGVAGEEGEVSILGGA
ncbi:MAG: sugar phosphate nucleotidyltransferase [Armatimonadota bacterium]